MLMDNWIKEIGKFVAAGGGGAVIAYDFLEIRRQMARTPIFNAP